jgi:hypothetical protein
MNAQVEEQSFEQAIQQHLLEHRESLVQQAVNSAITGMAESMKWTALEQAKKQLNEFFAEHVGPEVAKVLDANRENFVASVVATIKEVIDVGLKKQAEDWLKEMDSSYSRSNTIQKMFGGRGY